MRTPQTAGHAAGSSADEAPSSGEGLEVMLLSPADRLPPSRATAEPGSGCLSPVDAALQLACHVAEVGVGIPGLRTDLLARVRETLGAEAFMSFECRRRGRLRILESEGEFLPEQTNRLASLAEDARSSVRGQVILKRAARLLLAGGDGWFLGARFAEASLAREGWRQELLRFLASQFFLPVQSLDALNSAEAHRVLGLVGGNKRRTARLLGISPGTLYKLLRQRSLPKR